MNKLLTCASGFAAAAMFLMAHASPPSVNPEQMDLDADLNAKIMKEKAKQNKSGPQAGNSAGGGSSNCGSVNINSAQNTDKKSASGLKDMFGKQSTTVVTGPVINMANCK